MASQHQYFLVERQNIGDANWNALVGLFEAMGTSNSTFPAYNNHWRTRLDGSAVIYESNFDSAEVSIPAFKQLLADEFNVDASAIASTIGSASYSISGSTRTWQIDYNAVNRFKIERLGGGGASWEQSRVETLGLLSGASVAWEEPSS